MSTEVELLQAKPSCEDCLAWSADGELAIAVGENVLILIPNHGLSSSKDTHKPWTQVRIKINEFTKDEWPWKPLASFKDMSIGEEQSNSHVTAVAWSPPGIALYRRPVLAVLTSNHLLSIWACESNPKESNCWKKVSVVNRSISNPPRGIDGPKVANFRISSMAWAPVHEKDPNEQNPHPIIWGPFLLAIALESAEVRVLTVSSPYVTGGGAWDLTQCCQFQCPDVTPSPNVSSSSLLGQELSRYRCLDSIKFNPVWTDAFGIHTVVSCGISGAYTAVELSMTKRYPFQVSIKFVEGNKGLSKPVSYNHQLAFTDQLARLRRRHAMSKGVKMDSIDVWVHGRASFGSISAIGVTSQVFNEIEYKSMSEMVTTVLFHDDEVMDDNIRFPWQGLPVINKERAYHRIFGQLERNVLASVAINDISLKLLYTAIIAAILLPEPNRDVRLRQARDISTFLEEKLNAPRAFDRERQTLSYMESSNACSTQALRDQFQAFTNSRLSELLELADLKKVLDICPVPTCEKAVTWKRLDESCCLGGHPLGARCGITFMPILEQGQTKTCSTCCRDFINERANPTFYQHYEAHETPNTGATDAAKPILADHLLKFFETCPYCDGKFYTT